MYRKENEIYTGAVLDRFFFKQHIEDDETILHVAHRHWIYGVKIMFFPTIVFFFTWALLFYVSTPVVFYIAAVSVFISFMWLFHNFLDYYLDAWLITDKGIIDLAWHGWFHRESTRVLYSDIQGVSYEVKGVFATIFRYGHIAVEKISTGTNITLPGIPRPRRVQTVIMESMEHYLHKKNLKDSTTVQKLLADFVAGTMQAKELKELLKKS